jgi:hypothetical protein
MKKSGIVLGNGPSLSMENMPNDVDIHIGVNRSYEILPTKIWCTVDSGALSNMIISPYRPEWAYLRITALAQENSIIPCPSSIVRKFHGNSGQFGIYVAKSLGLSKLYLLGFDHDTPSKFYGEVEKRNVDEVARARRKGAIRMKKLLEDFEGEVWHFVEGAYVKIST